MLALILELAERYAADLSRRADIRATAGLQTRSLDANRAHPPRASPRFDRQGPDEIRIVIHFRIGDSVRFNRTIDGDQIVYRRFDLLPIQGHVRQIEIEPALAIADLPAGDNAGNHLANEVQAGVHSHQAMAIARPPANDNRLVSQG